MHDPSMADASIVIMGAGPAGLTAALELVRSGHENVVVVEQEAQVGGISRTITHNGNRMDIGGHRFFSKSDTVMAWWNDILPLETENSTSDKVLLIRNRVSRILYLRKFFDYPISLSVKTLQNLGLARTFSIGLGYIRALLFPIRPEKTLQDFFVNRFGRKLYELFFRDYTEKVWGVPCSGISADWGAQRVKGLSILQVLRHAVRSFFSKGGELRQKETETSLIEKFLYPKLGPGQLWEEVAARVVEAGGRVLLQHKVAGLEMEDGRIRAVRVTDLATGQTSPIACSNVISSLPIQELIPMLNAPQETCEVAKGLVYRDFITVGLLCRSLRIVDANSPPNSLIKDNWIYIQEPDVHLGRIQIFNNWSPGLVKDPNRAWLGLEFFATEGDALWTMPDDDFVKMAITELVSLGFVREDDVLDSTLLRVKKAYPAYFGSYSNISVVHDFLNGIPNLYPVGRNGMHRYNNMDHSMLSAMHAVSCINDRAQNKADVWKINEEDDYHERK